MSQPPLNSQPNAPAAEEEWETQTTRKQRKKQAKEAAANAPVPPTDAASSASSSVAASSGPVAAASDSTFPISTDGDDNGMEHEFMAEGLVGLDGQVIPQGAPTFVPAPQPAPSPAVAASHPLRKGKYAFDENQLPKCFVCQTRHDMGQCRKKDKL